MGTKSEVMKQKIKKKGHFNFAELYAMCFDHLSDADYEVAEAEYTEKVSGGGKEIQISWEASKKVTDYIKYTIEVRWHIIGLSDVEAEQDGKKVKTNKGDLKIEVKSSFETDYDAKWENKPLWKFMRGMYDNYIVRTTLDEYKGGVVDDTLELVSQIKAFLNMSK